MLELPTIAHVTLTVSDLDRSVQWYERLFDVKFSLDEIPGPFRRDHLAFACKRRSDLEAWKTRLDELGVANGGIVDADYGSGLSCRDPDNIALEFFAPAI
jgi:glyoxylase I family protein